MTAEAVDHHINLDAVDSHECSIPVVWIRFQDPLEEFTISDSLLKFFLFNVLLIVDPLTFGFISLLVPCLGLVLFSCILFVLIIRLRKWFLLIFKESGRLLFSSMITIRLVVVGT